MHSFAEKIEKYLFGGGSNIRVIRPHETSSSMSLISPNRLPVNTLMTSLSRSSQNVIIGENGFSFFIKVCR